MLDDWLHLQELGDGGVHRRRQPWANVHVRCLCCSTTTTTITAAARAHRRALAGDGHRGLSWAGRGGQQRPQSGSVKMQCELRGQHGGVLDDRLYLQERADRCVHWRRESWPVVHVYRTDPARTARPSATAGSPAIRERAPSPAGSCRCAHQCLAAGRNWQLSGPRRGRDERTKPGSSEVRQQLRGQHIGVLGRWLHLQECPHGCVRGRAKSRPDVHLCNDPAPAAWTA